jgi:hypothetical protein
MIATSRRKTWLTFDVNVKVITAEATKKQGDFKTQV